MSSFELVQVSGVDLLARFEGSGNCLHIDLAIATRNNGIQKLECLIPHGFEDIDYQDWVPQEYKQSCLGVLSRWITEGRLQCTEYNPLKLRYKPGFRGYADFWVLSECASITDVDPLDEYCKACSMGNILRQDPPEYLTKKEQAEFKSRAQRWRKVNQGYLEQKSKEFAKFWCDRVGELGPSGDGVTDLIHAVVRSYDSTTATLTDTEKLFLAIYNWAMSQFDQGWIPFLDTDYGVGRELRDLLNSARLSHLAGIFPWKTWVHLSFDDCDRSALFK